jgi:hypothetical protein
MGRVLLEGGGLPGSGVHSPSTDTHPVLFAEKSGAFCASAGATPAQMRPVSDPTVSGCRGVDLDMGTSFDRSKS